MNFRRGLFRFWLVLSLGWIGLIAYFGQEAFCNTHRPFTKEEIARIGPSAAERDVCRILGDKQCLPAFIPAMDSRRDCSVFPTDGYAHDWDTLSGFAEKALVPPMVAFLLGLVLLWVIGGFRRQR